jgi:bifunctional DNA-binding transcriptional regulator/antitoxin component of YhaV-PrlF toxin-antitoxin module
MVPKDLMARLKWDEGQELDVDVRDDRLVIQKHNVAPIRTIRQPKNGQ